jgi:hypothetical protein
MKNSDANSFAERQALSLEALFFFAGVAVLFVCAAVELWRYGRLGSFSALDVRGVALGVAASALGLRSWKVALLGLLPERRGAQSRFLRRRRAAHVVCLKLLAVAFLLTGVLLFNGRLGVALLVGVSGYLFSGSFVLMLCHERIFSKSDTSDTKAGTSHQCSSTE